MVQSIETTFAEFPDVKEFVETIKAYKEFFDDTHPIFVTRAPGRLDVMGGIADYSGSLVLQMPIREAALAAFQVNDTRKIQILSLGAETNNRTNSFEIAFSEFERENQTISYDEARRLFSGKTQWAAYVAGAFLVLMREKKVRFSNGAKILIDSKVPEGKGVSSSAAIEVASMSAIAAAFEIYIEPRELAVLCQKVENEIVGAPCGIMDQMSSACGEANKLLRMVCQPAEVKTPVEIPEEISFRGIDSGVRHSIGAGDYSTVRTGAFIGYRIIAELSKLQVFPTEIDGLVEIKDEKWHGYLANITPAEFEANFAAHLSQEISGADFLSRYTGITDRVTRVSPDKTYPVFYPTAHPIYENFRVSQFQQFLKQAMTEENISVLGQLMFESHASYSACGLGSPETDLLVEIARKTQNIYGAKITGGGSGGTVAILANRDADREIQQVVEEYYRQTKISPLIFTGSTNGSSKFKHLKLPSIFTK